MDHSLSEAMRVEKRTPIGLAMDHAKEANICVQRCAKSRERVAVEVETEVYAKHHAQRLEYFSGMAGTNKGTMRQASKSVRDPT